MAEKLRPGDFNKTEKDSSIREGIEDYLFEHEESRQKEKLIAEFREKARVPSRDGFHDIETLIQHINTMKPVWEAWGILEFTIDGAVSTKSFDGRLNAVACKMQGIDQQQKTGWITLELNQSKNLASYRNSINGEVIDTVAIPPEHDMQWLEDTSRARKVVKSRPKWMYSELLRISNQELWPNDSKVAVIGDPYQACDREGVTIIEYEYADEMVPPILDSLVSGKKPEVQEWLESLYFEDIKALERLSFVEEMGMNMADNNGNPYLLLVEELFHLSQRISEKIIQRADTTPEQQELKQLKILAEKLYRGTWIPADLKILLWNPDEQEPHIREWHAAKENTIKDIGNPKAWERFLDAWNRYLTELPVEFLKTKDPETDKKISQAKYWLEVLPTSTSPDRINTGAKYLLNLHHNFEELRQEIDPVFRIEVSDETESIPGYPVSLRTKKTIEQALYRSEQLLTYEQALLPHLQQEIQRLHNVPLQNQTLFSHLESFEQAWSKQHFFKKHTQKAIPVHGFFPHNFAGIEPQDRIIALTSVTMHGFNSMSEKDFHREIEAVMPYLKVGGKYILGPINQGVYFGGYSDFDANGLTRALRQLRDAGKIEYEFHKGIKGMPDDLNDWDSDPTILHNEESAHSLVITKKE